MSVEHYENFPVASILLPANLRPAVEAIYAFARSADDIADEGHAHPEERLAALDAYARELDRIEKNETVDSAIFGPLARTIRDYKLSIQPMRDLLSAFRQDVTTTRYATYHDLLDYCRRSANPVGALMLALYKADNDRNLKDSDAICTALQLINFWQDVAIDWKKSRIYIPQDDMAHFGVTETDIDHGNTSTAWKELMRHEVALTRALMLAGAPLALRLPGRIGWELRLVVQGGLRILERIELVDYDVFQRRPKLGLSDWSLMLWRAVRMKISLSRMPHVG